jgi:four helix bundle protein
MNKMAAPGGELSERTYWFARDVRKAVNQLSRSLSVTEDSKQVIRSSGSVAANYLEAQEGMSRKDFFYRLKVCRKEARESQLWLELLTEDVDASLAEEMDRLIDEANQLTRIFSSIVKKQDDAGD